ncbi:hypothetical protein AAVH_18085 [Aphelenchoides avenae]|nr:hypothetical protein AAVH_18085 [Aphelenchus avenae]
MPRTSSKKDENYAQLVADGLATMQDGLANVQKGLDALGLSPKKIKKSPAKKIKLEKGNVEEEEEEQACRDKAMLEAYGFPLNSYVEGGHLAEKITGKARGRSRSSAKSAVKEDNVATLKVQMAPVQCGAVPQQQLDRSDQQSAPFNYNVQQNVPLDYSGQQSAPFNYGGQQSVPFNYEGRQSAQFNYDGRQSARFNYGGQQRGQQSVPFNYSGQQSAYFNYGGQQDVQQSTPFNYGGQQSGQQSALFNYAHQQQQPQVFPSPPRVRLTPNLEDDAGFMDEWMDRFVEPGPSRASTGQSGLPQFVISPTYNTNVFTSAAAPQMFIGGRANSDNTEVEKENADASEKEQY